MATSPQSLAQWFAETGKVSSADAGSPDEQAYSKYLQGYYGDKYGVDTGGALYSPGTHALSNAGEYERTLADMDPSNVNYLKGLPQVEMSPERIQQIMSGAFSGFNTNSGDFNSSFDSQLNPQEMNALTAARSVEPEWDGWQKFLMAAMGGGFSALVGPSIMASLGEAGFSNPFSSMMPNGGGMNPLTGAEGGGGGAWDDIFNFADTYNAGANPLGTANAGLDLTGISTQGLSGFGSGGLASSITPTSLGGSLAGAAASGGGIWDSILSGMKQAGGALTQSIPGTNINGANTLAALANYFMKSQQQDQLNAAGNKAAQLNDPMQQTARLPFQAAYANLMFNPDSYKQTPYAVGQTDLANQAFQANVSKYGPGGTQFSDYLRNFQNIQSQDFFKLADQFQVAGGFNQGAGGGGSAAAGLLGQGATAGHQAYEGLGTLLSQPKQGGGYSIPGNFDFSSTYKPVENPFGTSSTFSQ